MKPHDAVVCFFYGPVGLIQFEIPWDNENGSYL